MCILELIKRIDDSTQEVRVESLKALSVWLSSLDKSYDTHTYHCNLEFIFQHLLLYLDDPDHQIQLMVLGKGYHYIIVNIILNHYCLDTDAEYLQVLMLFDLKVPKVGLLADRYM